MLLGVIDHHARRIDPVVLGEDVDDRPRPLVLVLEVRRVDVDQLLVLDREVDVVAEGRDLVARHAVQADLADAEHRRRLQISRDPAQHFARELRGPRPPWD